jgi:ubiquinone biosynthesis protein
VRIFRLLRIARVAYRHGLDRLILDHELQQGFGARLLSAAQALMFWRDISAPRAVRLRQALEALGPIFVKFGQVLSTRRDLLPLDVADELARLQDRVPPFPSELAIAQLEQAYGKPVDQVFTRFERHPGGLGLGGPGAFRGAAGWPRGRGQDPAPRHPAHHRT